MASSDGGSKWTDRLVPVPLWYLLAGGAGFAFNGIMDSMADDKAHAAPIQPPDEALRADVKQIARDVSDLKSSVAQIEGRLTSVERSVAELQQDVKTIKLAIR